jgi:uncharacterized membrane protein YphA (DoxX/SURF4 family)
MKGVLIFNLDFFNVYSGWGMWFLQFVVGVIFIYHGWPKLKKMTTPFSIGGGLHGIVEVVAALALTVGWYVREAGLVLVVIMLGAIYMKKFKWKMSFSTMTTGWEFDLVLFGAALYFLLG